VEPSEVAVLVLRIWLGTVMLAHGINHGRNIGGTASWFAAKGFRQARLNAVASAGAEIAIGIGLVVGFVTTLAAAGLAATMIVAFGAIHRFAGFFVFARPDEGYEYVVTLAVAATALAVLGPGVIAVDSLIGLGTRLDGWSGLVIVGAGLVVGIAQLALLWRRPG
jgi:putative oxidoreductase